MMRTPAEVRVKPGAQKSTCTTLAAPIGGLNARDAVANMAPTDANLMENWFPDSSKCSVRKGFQEWATFNGVGQTIMVYNGLSAAKVFVAVKNSSVYSVYDGTATGALSTAAVGGAGNTIEALGNARFDYINMGNVSGQYLIAVNGTNNPIQYDGSAWTVNGLTGGTPANYQSITLHANRIFVFDKNSFVVRYWPVDAISGAGSSIQMGSLFKLGGHMVAMGSITDDGGGLTNYIGFISSEGEVVAFAGTDPSSASTWSQAAHFRIGRPVITGSRTWTKFGSDALILCTDGVYPLRKAIEAQRKINAQSISDKIGPLIAKDIGLYGGKYGWTVMLHPTGNKLIVNVPTSEDVSSYQYVMNSQTGSWTKFTGWNSFAFEVEQDTLYMAGSGVLRIADTTKRDGNSAIMARCRQAYNYFGRRGNIKHLKMMRPLLTADGNYDLIVAADVDYKDTKPVIMRSVAGGSGDPWGGIWNVAWRGPAVTSLHWYGVRGKGHAIAPYLAAQVNGTQLDWAATDIVYEGGGILG